MAFLPYNCNLWKERSAVSAIYTHSDWSGLGLTWTNVLVRWRLCSSMASIHLRQVFRLNFSASRIHHIQHSLHIERARTWTIAIVCCTQKYAGAPRIFGHRNRRSHYTSPRWIHFRCSYVLDYWSLVVDVVDSINSTETIIHICAYALHLPITKSQNCNSDSRYFRLAKAGNQFTIKYGSPHRPIETMWNNINRIVECW